MQRQWQWQWPCNGMGMWDGTAHPFIVIGKASPVEHVHHGLEAEDGRLAELAVVSHCQRLGCQLDGLVCLGPGKLLLPHLPNDTKLMKLVDRYPAITRYSQP